MDSSSADTKSKFQALTSLTHSDQGVWWLNGFWEDGASAEAEKIYSFVQKFKEIEYGRPVIAIKGKKAQDVDEYKEGSDIDEFGAHKFLEFLGETLTVIELRKKLEAIDIDKNRRVSLSEYLLFKYSKTPEALVSSPQGDNKAEVDAAQAKYEEVQAQLQDVQTKLAAQKQALIEQKAEEERARKSLAESQEAKANAEAAAATAAQALEEQAAAEAKVRAAEDELKAAVDALHKEEEAHKSAISAQEAISNDESLGQVKRNAAKNTLAQLKEKDPLPLRQAQLTQGAALKKVEKERKLAEAATAGAQEKADKAKAAAQAAADAEAAAQKAAEAAEAARLEAEEQTRQVEAAEAQLKVLFDQVVAELEELKKKGGVAHGQIWWIERNLKEMRKYMPGGK